MTTIRLRLLPGEFAVCRLPADTAVPGVPEAADLYALTRTRDELSVVCPAADAPEDAVVERGWRALGVLGPLDFALTGILAGITRPLAEAGVSVFAVSTYDTDYVLVRADALDVALEVLRGAGYEVA
ncbi:MAG TPA: ACT domain-containing protein [Streptosporangiales bacterium]